MIIVLRLHAEYDSLEISTGYTNKDKGGCESRTEQIEAMPRKTTEERASILSAQRICDGRVAPLITVSLAKINTINVYGLKLREYCRERVDNRNRQITTNDNLSVMY